MKSAISRGYTLIELIVSVGLFAVVTTLSTGAYLMMISANQQAQSITTGINNLSFALETMTRTIRTGTNYNKGVDCLGDCQSFTVVNTNGVTMTYTTSEGVITQNGVALTDSSVNVTSLTFYVSGTAPFSVGSDVKQPYVTIIVSGEVIPKAGKAPIKFNVETSAVMRGTDL